MRINEAKPLKTRHYYKGVQFNKTNRTGADAGSRHVPVSQRMACVLALSDTSCVDGFAVRITKLSLSYSILT